MNPEYWLVRWEKKETGFHAEEIQPGLLAGWTLLSNPKPATVLVPLCGKSIDMLWLAKQGCKVEGIELSELACRSFFSENNLPLEESVDGNFKVFKYQNIRLWCGDLFHLRKAQLPEVDLIYDRASLVALPFPMRKKYAVHLSRLFKTASHVLITFEYDHEEIIGPPFSVPFEEVRALYGAQFSIQKVESRSLVTYQGSKMRRFGIEELRESTFLLQTIPKIP